MDSDGFESKHFFLPFHFCVWLVLATAVWVAQPSVFQPTRYGTRTALRWGQNLRQREDLLSTLFISRPQAPRNFGFRAVISPGTPPGYALYPSAHVA